MKKSVLIAVAFAGSLAFTAADAEPSASHGFYGQVSTGYLQLEDVGGTIGGTSVNGEYDAGWSLSGAVGFAFGNGLRSEFELGYGRSSYNSVSIGGTKVGLSGDIDMWSAYEAVYYDFDLGSAASYLGGVKPYLGGGFGFVHWDAGNVSATVSGTTFTGSGGNGTDFSAFGEAGLSLALSDRIDLVPAVRYIWVNDGESGLDDDTAWLFKVGMRYRF